MQDNNGLWKFSTEEWPEHQRIAMWRERFGRAMAKVDTTPLDDDPYYGEATVRMLPGLMVAWGCNSHQRVEATRELVAEGDDDLLIMMPMAGRAAPEQLGREVEIDVRGATLWSCAHLGSVHFSRGYSHLTLKLPRRELDAMVVNVDRLVARPLRDGTEALGMLRRYASTLIAGQSLETLDLQRLFSAHVRDLVALALGARSDTAEIARGRGLRAARLAAARAYILANLSRPNLGVTTVAASQQITPRYLQMLFDAEGTTFSKFVLKQRLALAHRMLIDPHMVARPIGVIALDAGFSDLSYFSRVFRRQFGGTPSDVRTRTKPSEA